MKKTIDLSNMNKKDRANWIAWCNLKGYKYKVN